MCQLGIDQPREAETRASKHISFGTADQASAGRTGPRWSSIYRLQQLTVGAQKIRFFLDQDFGMRAACLATFTDDIKTTRREYAFFVRIAN